MKAKSLKKFIHVSTSFLQNGFKINVGDKEYQVGYPSEVWNSFPKNLRQDFAETAAYYFTYHLYFKNKKKLEYNFAPSLPQSLFINGLLMTLPEAILELPEKKFTPDYLFKLLYQSQHDVIFNPPNNNTSRAYEVNPYIPDTQKVIIPLSLGKDSLLTLAVTRELGLKQRLVYFIEPTSVNEFKNKKKLGKLFMEEFRVNIDYIPVTLGSLREKGGSLWGWDLILLEYTLLLIPYLHYEKSGYLLWSQEQNYNLPLETDFGMRITMNYDETSKWRMMLTTLLKFFGASACVASCNEPLMEFSDTFILHRRYPEIAKYQLSCDNDHKNARTSRWCHACPECSRFYIYLLAMGIDPKRVGLTENMLTAVKIKYCSVFEEMKNGRHNYIYQFTDDLLFALFILYKKRIRGAVIDKFAKSYSQIVKDRIKGGLVNKFIKLHSAITVPFEYKDKILTIYNSELAHLKKYLNSYL